MVDAASSRSRMTGFLANRLLLRVLWMEKLGPARLTNYKLTSNVGSEPGRWDVETEANHTSWRRSQRDDSTPSRNYIIFREIGTCSFLRKLMGVLPSAAETRFWLTRGGAVYIHQVHASNVPVVDSFPMQQTRTPRR